MKILTKRETVSAIGNAHQTAETSPVSDRRNAAGRSITSCRITDTIIEEIPLPNA